MPNLISIGSRRSVLCGDGILRTGRVIYIHPEHRFAVLEFSGVSGRWREAILTDRAGKPKKMRKPYTAEEDDMILRAHDLARVAEKLGRTHEAVRRRRRILKERARNAVQNRA